MLLLYIDFQIFNLVKNELMNWCMKVKSFLTKVHINQAFTGMYDMMSVYLGKCFYDCVCVGGRGLYPPHFTTSFLLKRNGPYDLNKMINKFLWV